MDHQDQYERAKKVVEKKKGFYIHLTVYLGMGIFFFIVNVLTDARDIRDLWFFYPMIPWGVGLAIHYLTVFGFPGSQVLSDEWEKREIEKEMRRMDPENEDHQRLPPAEMDDNQLDLKEIQRKPNWDEKDFV